MTSLIERQGVMDGPIKSSQAVPAGLSKGCRRTAPNIEPGPEPARGANLDREELAALRAIVEGTARNTGAAFFQSLVQHLAAAIGVSYAFVAEFAGSPTRVRTLAFWGRDRLKENVEFDLAGTPCEDVVRVGLCHHPRGVQEKFPSDQDLVELGIESYLGVPLLDGDGRVLGHLAVCDERPMLAEPRRLSIFRIFATRAAVELERVRVEKQLVESERRYRELYEEAPNAYVAIGDDRRLLSVNHRATQLLGMPASELVDQPVLALFAQSPAGRTPAEQALRAGFDGQEISGGPRSPGARASSRSCWAGVGLERGPRRTGRTTRVMPPLSFLGPDGPGQGIQPPIWAQSVADVPHPRFDRIFFRRRSLRSLLRSAVLATSALVACWAISGCSDETPSDAGKMAKPMDKMDTGKMGTAMDKMDTGKMVPEKH